MTGRPKRTGRSPSRKLEEPATVPKKSPGRTKSPGRPKSPGRTKSPGRPKSPARVGKSPGRPKSPARPAAKRSPSPVPRKPSGRLAAAAKKKASPIRVSEVYVDLKKDLIDMAPYLAKRELSASVLDGPLSNSRERTSSSDINSTVVTRRSSARVASIIKEKLQEESDNEYNDLPSTINNKASSVDRESALKNPREFGGWPGALFFIFALPLGIIASQLYCSKSKCPELSFPANVSRNWRDYFDLEAAGWYLGFVAFQVLFSLLPIGKLVDAPLGKTSKFQYRCNGIWSLLFTLATIGGLCYLKVPVLKVVDKQLPLAVTAILLGILVAEVLYFRGRRAPVAALNAHGATGNVVVDFWMGREVNPRFGRLDLKWVLYRTAVIGMTVLNALLVAKALDSQTRPAIGADGKARAAKVDWADKEWPPALLLAAALQLLYALDALWAEDSFPLGFEAQSEGVGYMLAVGATTYPFVPTLIVKFLTTHKGDVPLYGLALIFLVHTVGYVIYRASNNQKNRFRKNPMDPALAHLQTIPTLRGKKLLVSGWWGWVRHPNYLGDIIMHWAWASTAGLSHWLPYVVPAAWTLMFLHRAVRDNERCRQRYGIYWERYTVRVKSLVLPKIF